MAAPGVTLVKSFTYRGAAEEFSNTYHFVGDAPSNDTDWGTLVMALVALEKTLMVADVTYERAYCYENTDDDSVFTYDIAVAHSGTVGTVSLTTGESVAPGDAAAWVRWKTARTNTHGKPIYLRKYFHGVSLAAAGSSPADTLSAQWADAADTFKDAVNDVSGDWPGIAGPDGVAPGAAARSTFVTTRTLRRRGKRPS